MFVVEDLAAYDNHVTYDTMDDHDTMGANDDRPQASDVRYHEPPEEAGPTDSADVYYSVLGDRVASEDDLGSCEMLDNVLYSAV